MANVSAAPPNDPAGRTNLNVVAEVESSVKHAVLDLLFPPVCRLCGVPVNGSSDFCLRCFSQLSATEKIMISACRRCGLPGGVATDAEPNAKCHRCPKKSPQFDSVAALWAYQDVVREAIVAAKFAWHADLADAMGRRLAVKILRQMPDNPKEIDKPDLVTFVPSHRKRAISRGGTSAETIALAVGRSLRIPVKGILRTTRPIEKQAWLSDQERLDNVRNAFDLKKGYASRIVPKRYKLRIDGRHILLVDDVLTTGATADEVSKVLRNAGARQVSLAVVARAVRKH